MALTQEQINRMIAGLQSLSPEQLSQMGGMYRDPSTGYGIHANYSSGGYDPATGDYSSGSPAEYWVSAPGATRAASSPYERYSTEGRYTGTGNYTPATDINKQLLKYGLALAGTAASGGAFGNLMGGGASSGGAGGFIGEGAASGIPAWDGAVGGSMLSAGEGLAATGASVGGAAAGAAGGSGGGLLSGLLPSGLKGVIGPAAMLAGGLLGSKPQETSQTSTRSIDPRFADAIFGQRGLLGMVQNNLSARQPQSSPLSNITPRGNGFSLFTGR